VCRPVCTMKTVQKKCGEWVTEQYCVPGKRSISWECIPSECTFDPCTCKTCYKPAKRRMVVCQGPSEMRCRKVWKERTVCEQVPCTSYVRETVCEKVPYTVCKKVPYTAVKKVPCTVTRRVKENVVKKVPYTVTKMQTEVVREQVPYTVCRCVKGAYVDQAGVGYDTEGPGRCFREGASVETCQ